MTLYVALLVDENGVFYLPDSESGLEAVDDETQNRLDEIFETEEK